MPEEEQLPVFRISIADVCREIIGDMNRLGEFPQPAPVQTEGSEATG